MLNKLSATSLAAKLSARELTVSDVVQEHLAAIDANDSKLGTFLTRADEGQIEAQVSAAQAMVDAGTAGPLTGIPVAIKDNISTEGLRTTCASKILENYIPPFDATVIKKLKSAGAIIVGKTNLDEFAMGGSNEHSAFFPARNPWDTTRSPGGSSGGSAAAVAGRLTPISLGSDTGGSIRQPASLTGIVGYKPTYGMVSRYGLVAFGSSLDQIGPFARTVEDAAALATVISGHCELDSTSLPGNGLDFSTLKSGSLKGVRFAAPKEFFGEALDAGVAAKVQEVIELLRREGAVVDEVSVPEIAQGVTTYYIIAPAEASSNLARFDGVRYGPREMPTATHDLTEVTRGRLFGHEVKARIMIGTYVLSAGYYDAYYLRAQQVRGKMVASFEALYQNYDFVIGPTSPIPAFKIGELQNDPMAEKLVDLCTIPANMGGFPAVSLPCGLSNGLPVGVQLMGKVCDDARMMSIAFALESALAFSDEPNLN